MTMDEPVTNTPSQTQGSMQMTTQQNGSLKIQDLKEEEIKGKSDLTKDEHGSS